MVYCGMISGLLFGKRATISDVLRMTFARAEDFSG